jgi:NADH-quinone oxidoreductase subunit J
MVLFLFVVMMLDIHIDSIRQGFWRHFPLALVIGALITLEMAVVLFGGFRVSEAPIVPETVANAAGEMVQYSNTKALGTLLYSKYLYPVEIAAVLLLIAMITAIALTLRERKDSKKIDPAQQVRVRARDRLELVRLEPTRAPVPVEPVAPTAEEEKKS